MRYCLKLGISRLPGAAAIMIILSMSHPAPAQTQTDGSMGPAVSLSGDMVIDNALGKQVGANLFHSFSVFNIRTGESALFTSGFTGTTRNVIARVTGNGSSWIDGALASDIPGADLWLFNPNGIAFGKNASLDLQGSLYASTADYLGFEDGDRFEAQMPAGSEVLSTASPSAFGFLQAQPAPITVSGSSLTWAGGKSFALVGGDLDISGGTLAGEGGRLDLVSVASPGEVLLSGSDAMDVGGFARLGDVSLRGGSMLDVSDSTLAAGSVYIRGGRFMMANGSQIYSITGSEESGPIDIETTGDISIAGDNLINSSTWAGRAADIRISAAGDFTIASGSTISSMTASETYGDSGGIAVAARDITIADASKISTNNWSLVSDAGDIEVTASGTISISGGPADFSTGIESSSLGSGGNAGRISLEAGYLTMDGGTINTHNLASLGSAGDIAVEVATMELAGEAIISSSSRGYGPGGRMTIHASEKVSLTDGSSVQSGSMFTGTGGLIEIAAPELSLDHSQVITSTSGDADAGDILFAGKTLKLASGSISSNSLFAAGAGGSISIVADSGVELENTGASALERPFISTTASGSGDAGSIEIVSPGISVSDGYIDSSASLLSTGNAGSIKLEVNDLALSNGGLVETVSAWGSGQGGTIEINAADSLSCSGFSPTLPEVSSRISANTYGQGDAGRISISAGSLSLALDGSVEVASFGEGAGGSLQINAGTLTIDGSRSVNPPGLFSGAYGSGDGGDILVTAGEINLEGGVISARSSDVGKAGALIFDVRDALRLIDGTIWTSSELSAGGNIDITVGDRLYLQDSLISASAGGVSSTDNGGNLTVGTPQFMILNQSDLLARANAGNGGNIMLGADYFVQSAGSAISATSRQGLDGEIVIDSPNQVRGAVALLEFPSIDISAFLRERCAAAVLREQSSFTIEGLSGIPQRPGDFLTSPGFRFSLGSGSGEGASSSKRKPGEGILK